MIENPTPTETPRLPDWWWRPLAFAAGFALIIAVLFRVGRDIYMEPSVVSDHLGLAEMRKRKVLLLGTSHGHDLSLEAAGFDGADLTHGGQDLFEMAYMARTVKQRSRKLDTVIISLSYFSFNFDNSAYELKGVRTRVGRRTGLYSTFARLSIIPGDSAEYIKGIFYPVITPDHYQAGFEGIAHLLEDGTLGAHPTPDVEKPAPDRRHPMAWFRKHAKRRCESFHEFAKNMTEHHPGLEEDSFRSTLELAKELRSSSIRVVFFTPPYTQPYNECFGEEYQSRTRVLGRRLADESDSIYFDFSHDDRFTERTELFEDSDHLNERGRRRFSQLLKQRLNAQSR